MWRYKARIEPDRYDKCRICLETKPHKKMYDLGNYTWVCDNCMGLYTYKNIKARLKDIDTNSNK